MRSLSLQIATILDVLMLILGVLKQISKQGRQSEVESECDTKWKYSYDSDQARKFCDFGVKWQQTMANTGEAR